MLLSKSTQTAASTDDIFARAPERADVPASPMLPKCLENARCSTPVPCVEEMECESPEFAGDETYRPSLESFEDSFGRVKSSCNNCGHVASWQSQPLIGDKPAGNVL
ncbi:hypothetical protein MTO96_044823 [Rhipicephalus appendiculatus]